MELLHNIPKSPTKAPIARQGPPSTIFLSAMLRLKGSWEGYEGTDVQCERVEGPLQ